MRHTCFLVLFSIIFHLHAQQEYPQDAFRSPLDIPLVLAGTFGELRSNHFHAGVDIKTQQREGLPVFAIADGTVTRIKVSHWGYGKVLYIAHPNGYTSVYGHLQKFGPEIEEYVKKVQYREQSYEVEIFPDYGDLKVIKGNTIAYSGNTGGSAGPHLHFEIRNSVNGKPTNPLLYGYEVRDATDPTLLELYGYPISDGALINQSAEKIQLNFTRQSDGSFLADPVSAIGTIGFGINTFDRLDMAANKNGVYAIKQTVNGRVYSEFDFETFSFGESLYINTLIDYEHYYHNRDRIQKCFKEPYNYLSIYKTLYNDGKIDVEDGMSYNVELHISDLAGNTTKLVIPVEGKQQEEKIGKADKTTDHFVIADKPNNFDLGVAKVYFPANTFYKDFFIHLEKGSDTVTIHDNSVAAHRNFTISFDPSGHSEADRKQLFIAHLERGGRPSYSKTYKRDGSFTTRTRTLGTYTLVKDSVAPEIRPKNFKAKQWLSNYSYLSLTISDDLSGIDTYSATLNGKWILMEYEPKTNTITYDFDDNVVTDTECELKVIVTDNVGNSSTYTANFFRK